MKRKIIIVITLCLFIFIGTVNAKDKEYKINESTGKYVVSEGACSYSYFQEGILGLGDTVYGFQIEIENDRFSDISSVNGYTAIGKYNESMFFNSLKYSSFFSKDSPEFSCPEKIYVNYLASPDGKGGKLGWNLETACNSESIGTQCKEATYISGSGKKRYVEKDVSEPEKPQKTKTLTCSYKKVSSSSGSEYQSKSSSGLVYNKFSDGTHYFSDTSNDQHEITSGSLNSCEDYIDVKVSGTNNGKYKYDIVSSCNDNIDAKCIRYQNEKLASTIDSEVNDDGTTNNENAAGVINPDEITELEPSKVEINNIDFQESTCDTLLGDTGNKNDPAYYLNFAFSFIKYAAIILLLVLTIMEYAKAITASNQDAIIKATQVTVKRVIIAVVIFLLPMLINFILRILGIISTNGTCGIGF